MFEKEYLEKLRSPEEAVKVVNSGDRIDYMFFNGLPKALDKALAQRKDELHNVEIVSGIALPPLPELPLADPKMEHFEWTSMHYGAFEAGIADQGICTYIPMLYHEVPGYYRRGEIEIDVAMIRVCPMDKFGYFNFSINTSHCEAITENAKVVIVEENKSLPYAHGGNGNQIHISEVDFVVRGQNEPPANVGTLLPTDAETKIAEHILTEIHDGCCIQLGIGGLPNCLGAQIAQAGLKDLGVHTEMLADAYLEMWKNGCISGAKKEIDRKKIVFTFALGSPELYEFIDHNPEMASYPVDYTNNPHNIARISNMVSINGCLEVDFYGQVNSEMQGSRQFTGTGGQWDFVLGAYHSKGGKSFLCMPATYKDRDGKLHSKIKPFISTGAACTISRQMTHFIVTEYGKAQMKGKSIWKRAENIINIAHPDFRDELIIEATKNGLWKRSNRIEI